MEPASRRPHSPGRALIRTCIRFTALLASALTAPRVRRDTGPHIAGEGPPGTREPSGITPTQLAKELGHGDDGRAIRVFLRDPDDGRGPFTKHLYREPWQLSPEQADRVRERFAF